MRNCGASPLKTLTEKDAKNCRKVRQEQGKNYPKTDFPNFRSV
jgi:hypothetical protein